MPLLEPVAVGFRMLTVIPALPARRFALAECFSGGSTQLVRLF